MPRGVEVDIIRGLYVFRPASEKLRHHVQLFGSGSIMQSVLKAQELLAEKYQISSDVWSATSYQQLRNEALSADRWNRLHPEDPLRVPFIVKTLQKVPGPIIAATDFTKTVPDFIRPWVKQRYITLGTDGYGRSSTREELRRFFEVDAESVVIAALSALYQDGQVPAQDVSRAIRDFGVDPEKPDPLDPKTSAKATK
jgi:pyruvate dehydrogenase E1 component